MANQTLRIGLLTVILAFSLIGAEQDITSWAIFACAAILLVLESSRNERRMSRMPRHKK